MSKHISQNSEGKGFICVGKHDGVWKVWDEDAWETPGELEKHILYQNAQRTHAENWAMSYQLREQEDGRRRGLDIGIDFELEEKYKDEQWRIVTKSLNEDGEECKEGELIWTIRRWYE